MSLQALRGRMPLLAFILLAVVCLALVGFACACLSDHPVQALERALGAIKAKATVMAGETDLYFTPADIEADAASIPGARFQVIPSLWGHIAGAGLNSTDSQFIEAQIKALLAI